jgi:hypothetical protein
MILHYDYHYIYSTIITIKILHYDYHFLHGNVTHLQPRLGAFESSVRKGIGHDARKRGAAGVHLQ